MSSGLAPRYPQGRRIGLTLVRKVAGNNFSFTSLFFYFDPGSLLATDRSKAVVLV